MRTGYIALRYESFGELLGDLDLRRAGGSEAEWPQLMQELHPWQPYPYVAGGMNIGREPAPSPTKSDYGDGGPQQLMTSSRSSNGADVAVVANRIRRRVIEMLLQAGSGHSAGSLGMADVFATLYFRVLNIDPGEPWKPDRDRVVLSAGHICPVWYATLAERGYFPVSELATLRKLGSRLQGHPHARSLPGVETSSGPLGQGLSQAIGMALASSMDRARWRTHAVLSDGEHDEGQTWEAVMFAAKERLGNLTAWVDRNNIQIDGLTEDVMPLEPLRDKYEAFGWHVIDIDGHNHQAIADAASFAESVYQRPTVVICHTIPGKGVDFMEEDYTWHGIPPDRVQAVEALRELRNLRGRIVGEHE